MRNKIVTLDTLAEISGELRGQGKRIAATSGCFDILHAGHVTYLEEAKAKGDILVVLLNADVSVRRLKGASRPVVPQDERAVVIAGLGCVDYVSVFGEDTPCRALSCFKPDIFVKGGEYEGMHIPELDILAAYGGRVVYADMVNGCSSTNIMEKIRME